MIICTTKKKSDFSNHVVFPDQRQFKTTHMQSVKYIPTEGAWPKCQNAYHILDPNLLKE